MEHQRKDANIIFASLFIQTAGCEQTEYWKNKIHIFTFGGNLKWQ